MGAPHDGILITIVGPDTWIEVVEKRTKIQFPRAHPLIADEIILIGTRLPNLVVDGVQIQSAPLGDDDVGITANETVGRRVGLIGMFQNANPLGIPNVPGPYAKTLRVLQDGVVFVECRQQACGIKAPVTIEIKVMAGFYLSLKLTASRVVGDVVHINRRSGIVVLIACIDGHQEAIGNLTPVGQSVAGVERIERGVRHIKPRRIDEIGRYGVIEMKSIGRTQHATNHFGLRTGHTRFSGHFSRQVIGRYIDGTPFTPTDAQKDNRHERYH